MVQRSHELRHTSEAGFRETVNALGIDLRSLIEHELRTPLASVTGYVSLLESLPEDEQFSAFLEYRDVIRAQSGYALEALEKLSLTLAAGVDQQTDEQDVQEFNGSSTIQEICVNVRDHAAEFLSPKAAENLQVKFHQALDEEIVVSANQRLFRWAIWEVLKNAASHARHGRIEVNSYYTDGMLVVDIMDDGLGLSPGSEELVFLRFYQDPTTNTARNGKRGLGLGLFLARHIVERHMGKLMFIRKQNRGGFFRFLWPAKRVSDLKREA